MNHMEPYLEPIKTVPEFNVVNKGSYLEFDSPEKAREFLERLRSMDDAL